MHTYPRFTDSYQKNQAALLNHLGLTDPSLAPFARILCFEPYRPIKRRQQNIFIPSSLDGGQPMYVDEHADGSRSYHDTPRTPGVPREGDVIYTLSPESGEPESEWLRLACSAMALHHVDSWPEIRREPEIRGQRDCWWFWLDDDDRDFLAQFFSERWEKLMQDHPLCRDIMSQKTLSFDNTFDQGTLTGQARLEHWLRWIVELIWDNRFPESPDVFSCETDAYARAIGLVVRLLGDGTLQVVQQIHGEWVSNQWLLHAVELIRSGVVISNCCYTAMTDYWLGNGIIGPAGYLAGSTKITLGYFPFASKFSGWGAEQFAAQGLQVGFGTYVHPSAYIGSNVTIGHGVTIQAGAFIGNHVTIESQAYIGVGTHIGNGSTIGVGAKLLDMTPNHKRPVIIGYEVTIQAGAIIGPNNRQIIPHYSKVLSGVIITEDTRFYFIRGGEILNKLEEGCKHYTISPMQSVSPQYPCVLVT